jgi:hypothetical protein
MSEQPRPEPGPLGQLRFANTPPPSPRWKRLLVPAGVIFVILLGVVLLTVFRGSLLGTTGDAGHPAKLSTMREGECFDKDALAKTRTDEDLVTALPCTSSHDAEVYGTAKLPLDDGIDTKVLSDAAQASCRGLLRPNDVRDAPVNVTEHLYFPSFPGRYERTVICTFEAMSAGKLDHPIRSVA